MGKKNKHSPPAKDPQAKKLKLMGDKQGDSLGTTGSTQAPQNGKDQEGQANQEGRQTNQVRQAKNQESRANQEGRQANHVNQGRQEQDSPTSPTQVNQGRQEQPSPATLSSTSKTAKATYHASPESSDSEADIVSMASDCDSDSTPDKNEEGPRGPKNEEVRNEEGWKKVDSRKLHRRPKPTIPITFNEFPVIIQDAGNGALKDLQWDLATHLDSMVGEVRCIRSLTKIKARAPFRVVIGCTTELQQQRLARVTEIDQVKVTCSIPTPTVVGVIKGIPLDLTEEDIRNRMDPRVKIKTATRLSLRSGAPSRAVRLTIEAASLPPTIQVAKMSLPVEAYVHPTIQCHNCFGLGHKTPECWRNQATCATCGDRGHRKAHCTSDKYRCINCKGDHPATSKTCPAKLDHEMANKLMSTEYMPRTLALAKARRARTNPPPPEQQAPVIPASPPQRQDERPTYAEMTAGKANKPPASSQDQPQRTHKEVQTKPNETTTCKDCQSKTKLSQDNDKPSGDDSQVKNNASQDKTKYTSTRPSQDSTEAIIEQVMTWTSNILKEMQASTSRMLQELKDSHKQELDLLKQELQTIKKNISHHAMA